MWVGKGILKLVKSVTLLPFFLVHSGETIVKLGTDYGIPIVTNEACPQ